MPTIRPLFTRALVGAVAAGAALTAVPASAFTARGTVRARATPPDLAATFNATFTRFAQPYGVIAGDGGRSTPLPDGRVVWFFGDSNAGQISRTWPGSDGTLKQVNSTWLNNSAVVTDRNGGYQSVYGWDQANHRATSLFAPTGLPAGHYYWTGAPIVEPTPAGNRLQVFLMDVAPSGKAPSTGRRIATLDPSSLAILSIGQPLPQPSFTDPVTHKTGPISCGNALLRDRGYTYVYCSWTEPGWAFNNKTIVARTPDGDLNRTSLWQFDAGNGAWTTDASRAVAASDRGLNTIVKIGSHYVTLVINSNDAAPANHQVRAYASTRPTGPWTAATDAPVWTYDIPAAPSLGLIDPYRTYLPQTHPELASFGCLPISWSNDIATSWGKLARKIGYRPRFACLPTAGL